eukprot:TRINITY_DN28329_c0_g1_i1.p2 TRINITY_DN28329_c0_g1~~TRINITY_DN28329_c0_g1_i1.p2  ORF type:complete len:193 (+),score=47.63 TRINITY_DN28329_c0_g1_i1:44-580(+)
MATTHRQSAHGRCRWQQSEDEVELLIPLGALAKARDVNYKVSVRRITVGLSEQEHLQDAELCHPVVPSESFWQLEDDPAGEGKVAVVSLKKARAGVIWRALLLADDPKPGASTANDEVEQSSRPTAQPTVKKTPGEAQEKRGSLWSTVEPGTLAACALLLVSVLVGMFRTFFVQRMRA